MVVVVVVTVLAPPEAGANAATTSTGRVRADAPIQAAGFMFGRLRIPTIGVDEPVREGVAIAVIDIGVAHWVGTASPGGQGNVVLAGHRTTHSAPFRDLDRLRRGDRLFLAGFGGTEAVYRVTEVFVVTPRDVWITYDLELPTVTLFACHPKGSATHRIVVRAVLASPVPLS